MSSKGKEKYNSKILAELVEEVEQLKARLKNFDDFFRSVHGNSPDVMNLHFLLQMLRQSNKSFQEMNYNLSLIEEFMLEKNLKVDFEAWLDAKAKQIEEEQAKIEKEKQEKAKAASGDEGKTQPTENSEPKLQEKVNEEK